MTLTFTARFAYNEPRIGNIEVTGPRLSNEEIMKQIEESFPEAIDIEILDIEEEID